ncbi:MULTISPECIES: hypothetical protein [Brevibacillus]
MSEQRKPAKRCSVPRWLIDLAIADRLPAWMAEITKKRGGKR